MGRKKNFVSIIIPAYNEEGKIGGCISSLVNQTYERKKYEIIVVDNGSTDGTKREAKKYPTKVVSEVSIQSSYAARNKGIKVSKGDIIAFTDADCKANPEWLEKGVHKARKDKKVGAVAGKIDGGEQKTKTQKYLNNINWLSQKSTINHKYLPYPQTANAIYKKDVFEEVGLFEERWISGGDADIAWRMQIETDYEVAYDEKAVVEHNHRQNIKSLWLQAQKWGRGYYLLKRKYGLAPQYKSKKEIIERYKKVIQNLVYYIYNFTKEKLYKKVSGCRHVLLCDTVFKIGYDVGYIKEALR